MLIIGLISGTSADAMDATLCEIEGAPPNITVRELHSVTVPFPDGLQQRIHDAGRLETSRIDAVCQLNYDLGELFAEAALQVVARTPRPLHEVDLIGLHGQTVWHMVQPDGRVTSTLQLTEASILAERTGVTTISNFRARDIAVGGQGAPMTAYADWLLLRHESEWRAVQNIGGIGNVTFLPPLSDDKSKPLAFDTGPGNVLIDAATLILTDGAQTYDRDGALAAQGWVNDDWLKELSTHPYYDLKPPKTTGRELFSVSMAQELIEEGKSRGLDDASIVATLTRLTAWSIADATRRFAPLKPAEFIIGGGGRHNPTLLAMLRDELPGIRVLMHEDVGFNSDSKEAVVFALLAYETWHGRPGNLPALTGAEKSVILGQITPGENYPDLVRQTWC